MNRLVTSIYEPEKFEYPGVEFPYTHNLFDSTEEPQISTLDELLSAAASVPTSSKEEKKVILGDVDFGRLNPYRESPTVSSTPSNKSSTPPVSTPTPSVTLAGSDESSKAIYLMKRLENELGLTKEQAAGIAGNIYVESKFNPKAKGDKGQAHGIAQWHSNRRSKDLINWSYEQQVDYLIKELQTERTWNHFGGLNKLRTLKSAADSAAFVDKRYERSSGQHKSIRQAKAEAYAKMKFLRGGKI